MDATLKNAPDMSEDIELRLFLEALFQKYHYDFRGYSMASLKRRLKAAREYFMCDTYSLLQNRLLNDPGILEHKSILRRQVTQQQHFRRDVALPHAKHHGGGGAKCVSIWTDVGGNEHALGVGEGINDRLIRIVHRRSSYRAIACAPQVAG